MRKKWKHYIDRMLTFALIGILLPLFITIICQRMRLEEVIYGTYNAITETAEREGGEELEEQLPFILAKEIRADAEDAALMAQCVIARTTLYDAAARGEEQPAAFSEEELRQALGETYEKAMERLGGDERAGALLERWLCVCCISCDQCRKYERYEPVCGSGGAISSRGGVPGGSDGGGYALGHLL